MIMKKIFYLMLAVAAFGFVACSDDDTQATTIDVVRSDIGFEAEGGNGAIEIRVSGGLAFDAALIATAAKLPATTFNMAVAMVVAPILSKAIRKALEQNHIKLN